MSISSVEKVQYGASVLYDIQMYVEGMCSGGGSDRKFMRFIPNPSNELFLGCLYPRDLPQERIIEESLSDGDESIEIEDENDIVGSIPLPTLTKPSSMSVSFLTKPIGNITIHPSFSVYYRVAPTMNDYINAIERENSHVSDFDYTKYINSLEDNVYYEHPPVWERVDAIVNEVIFDIEKPEKISICDTEIPFPTRIPWVDPPSNMPSSILKQGTTGIDKFWKHENRSIDPKWCIQLQLKDNGIMPGQPEEYHLFTISLINITPEPSSYLLKRIIEPVIFNCKLNIRLGDVTLKEFCHEWDYDLPYSHEITGGQPPEPFLIKYPMAVWGNGCFPEFDQNNNEINTDVCMKTAMKRISPWDVWNYSQKDSLNFSNLSRNPIECLRDVEKELTTYNKKYKSQYDVDRKANDDFSQFNFILKRYLVGIVAIENDPLIRKAFRLMNETYCYAYGEDGGWRLFQLIFIVGNITSTANVCFGESEDDESVELLFVATGGGKTEAYVGLTIWLLFY